MRVSRAARLLASLMILWTATCLEAAEAPYFVTYSHQMEEPGSLEISLNTLTSKPDGGHRFLNALTELEYGLKGWWTTEVYLHGQSTLSESALFTGYRWENRFRLLPREHWINPVLYIEWDRINGADKGMQEVVGFDAGDDFLGRNEQTRWRWRQVRSRVPSAARTSVPALSCMVGWAHTNASDSSRGLRTTSRQR